MYLFIAILLFLTVQLVSTSQNVTVVDTDPSITYEGPNTGDAPICTIDANGFVTNNRSGCYAVLDNCTSSVAMGQSPSSAASFKFKGSAIYINSLLFNFAPVYTVTLDGNSTDVDGVRPSQPFLCSNLFSATNLDPSIEHTIRLSIKGPSPNRNMTVDPNGSTVFSLINFMYTVPDPSSNSSGNNTTNGTNSGTSTSSGTSIAQTALFTLMSSLVGLGFLAIFISSSI